MWRFPRDDSLWCRYLEYTVKRRWVGIGGSSGSVGTPQVTGQRSGQKCFHARQEHGTTVRTVGSHKGLSSPTTKIPIRITAAQLYRNQRHRTTVSTVRFDR